MTQTVPPDQVAAAIVEILKEYEGFVDSVVEEATEKAGKLAAKKVRENITSSGIGGTGKYKKSITSKKLKPGGHAFLRIVYAKDPEYRLTHLLQYGHAKVNGGRTRAFPHWNVAAREAKQEFAKMLQEGLQK